MSKVTIPQPHLVNDELLLIFKRGDQSLHGARDFELISCIDHDEWEIGHPIISDHMASVFVMVTAPKDQKEFIQEKININANYKEQKIQKRICVDSQKLSKEYKDKTLAKKVVVPIQEGTEFNIDETWLIEKDFTGLDFVEDNNAITSGTYTVGSGGDYTTFSLFELDLGTQTGDISAVQISDVTETTPSLPNNNQGGFNQIYTTNTPHLGDSTLGHKIYVNISSSPFLRMAQGDTGGDLIIDGLNIEVFSGATPTYMIYSQNAIPDFYIRNCIINGTGCTNSVIRISVDNNPWYIYNNISIGTTTQIDAFAANSGTIIENNSVLVTGTSVRCISCNNRPMLLRNNISIADSGGAGYYLIGSTSGYNNATNDASGEDGDFADGSGNISNLNLSAFQSTTSSDSNFLYPLQGGPLNGTGTNPTIAGHDQYLNLIDIVTDDVDIGAYGLSRGAVEEVINLISKSRQGSILGIKNYLKGNTSNFENPLGIKKGIY